jgi:DNA polymerase I-like protein with 3'-5' exonuclease and polymerase domains
MAKNFPIQGTSGSMTKIGAIYLEDSIEKLNLQKEIKIVNIVHDEIVLEVNPIHTEIASKLITESMEKAGRMFCKTIPMIAEACVSKYWTH